MSFIDTDFCYNGVWASDMGVSLVHIDTSFLQLNFGLQKTINKDKIKHRDMPIYYNVEKNTYPIPITIAKTNYGDTIWTDEDRILITQWLFPDDQFHEFITPDYPDLIFYLQFTKGDFNNNSNKEGYADLETESMLPYPVTPIYQRNYDLSNNTTSTVIKVDNLSNVDKYYKPFIKIELIGNTTEVRIKNLSVNNEETIFNNLTVGETLTIDCDTQQITSSTNLERISNFNFVFPRLIQGLNKLEITGQAKLTIICQFPMMI